MAINFPSTAGQATDGTFTYTAAGITYSWNGESWTAAGSGATATDLTVFSVTQNAAGSAALSYNSNTGVFSYTPPDLSAYLTSIGALTNHTDVNISNVADQEYLRYNAANLAWENTTIAVNDLSDVEINSGGFNPLSDGDMIQWDAFNSRWINSPVARGVSTVTGAYFAVGDAGGGTPYVVQLEGLGPGGRLELTNGGDPVAISFDFNSGVAGQVITATGDDGFGNATGATWASAASGLQSRTTAQTTTVPVVSGGSTDISIATPATYALLKIETSHAAWVTLYTDTASRTADASRTQSTDPIPGSGVIAEVITTGNTVQLISPGTIAYNSAGTGTTYAKVQNNSAATASITVTLHYVQLEA